MNTLSDVLVFVERLTEQTMYRSGGISVSKPRISYAVLLLIYPSSLPPDIAVHGRVLCSRRAPLHGFAQHSKKRIRKLGSLGVAPIDFTRQLKKTWRDKLRILSNGQARRRKSAKHEAACKQCGQANP